jgi:hypothetical protein
MHALVGRLRRSENLGAGQILHVDLVAPASGTVICSIASGPETLPIESGELALLFAPTSCHVFDAEGQRIADDSAPATPSPELRTRALT